MDISLRDFENKDIEVYEKMQKEINASQYMSRTYPNNYGTGDSEYIFKSILLNKDFIGAIYFEPDLNQTKSYYMGILIGKKNLHGKGIGKEAIKKGIEILKKEKDIDTIKLNVRANNKRAINCYLSFGFKSYKSFHKKLDDGNIIKCYSMQYRIKTNITLN